MRILIDECIAPRQLTEFAGLDAHSALRVGYAERSNGELLRAILADGFDLLVTLDRNLAHQQNLRKAGIAVVILVGGRNRLRDLVALMPSARLALGSIRPGEVVEITA